MALPLISTTEYHFTKEHFENTFLSGPGAWHAAILKTSYSPVSVFQSNNDMDANAN